MSEVQTYEGLLAENERLRIQLDEATETIQAIRTGQIDALVVEGEEGHELYTLKTADTTYRVIIETMNEGAVTLGAGGLIVYCNSTFAVLVDMPLSQVIGLPFYQFVTPDCLPLCYELFTEGRIDNRKAELLLIDSRGNLVPCLLSVTELKLDEGTSLSVIITDLTIQKETQQLLRLNNDRLEKSNTALEISNNALNLSNDNLQQFAYVASHDLQEPLRKIQSFGDLLKTNYGPELGDAGVDMINRMGAAATRMSMLIKDLLNYSRLTTQQVPFSPIDLTLLVTDILDDLSISVSESNAVVEFGELPVVQGDAGQLHQLFLNLLSNALKFHPVDIAPRIQVVARTLKASDIPVTALSAPSETNPDRLFHEISVTDNGIGFEEKYLDRIFQVFQRLHGKTHYPGSGVGLAICRKVVLNHRGGLTARSQSGEGATFIVYLPA
ncbi:sensor histidine kinase [Fibrivirga algicola]|uniref:histidine kinase n=1 Tax=Fibrivirga algicola TaxID=2950420 RepID=A0ABX0QJ66_9BACT|nr:ATP-binding protein [Fibrivirga algicola]ARK12654.1 PAS domain-containing sensor histidine kinase [Fibrella sp. ES10-3-2-2]NID12181.1 PAS domain-containing protein [Fibrivirga algicola]